MNSQHTPLQWRKVKEIIIPKPGKDDYSNAKSFRPISLTSVLLNGLERLIDRHMKDILHENNHLNQNQHAYQEGKSTETALHDIVTHIENTFTKKEYAMATFMDIAGAFDNISLEAMNRHVSICGFPQKINEWIKNMLANRIIIIDNYGLTSTVKATRGTPQGGVLSPNLWILTMNSLLNRLNNDGHIAIAYADDLTVICKGKFLHTLSERSQAAVKIVERWCKEVELTVNPNKSETVIFTKNRKMDGFKNPIIFNGVIPKKDEAKYLGVILDSKLNWSKHIKHRTRKCLRIFWYCRKTIGKSWGLTAKNILWIYNTIVKPMLAYGAFLWWYGTNTVLSRSKHNHVQRVACLAITGAMSTTPQAAMEILLGLPKLYDYISAKAKITAYQLRAHIREPQRTYAKHTEILNDLYATNSLIEAEDDHLKTVFIFERPFEVIIPSKEDWENKNITINYYKHVYFTDGSVKVNGSGYGALYVRDHTIIRGQCGVHSTTKQTELAAIHACCIHAIRAGHSGPICIYSDSKNALMALKKCKINSKLIYECIKYLTQLAFTNGIALTWVPGHSGIYGNDIADRIAKFAASEQCVSAEPLMRVERSYAKTLNDRWSLRGEHHRDARMPGSS